MKTKITALSIILVLFSFLSTCEMITTPGSIDGNLINNSECKYNKNADLIDSYPDSLSCISYQYDASEQVLTLQHINSGFNCCPGKLSCDFSLSGDTIIIEESEKEAGCNCNCLFDLSMEISGVENRVYYIKIIEPYVESAGWIIFQADLTEKTGDTYCVTRLLYPWGLTSVDH